MPCASRCWNTPSAANSPRCRPSWRACKSASTTTTTSSPTPACGCWACRPARAASMLEAAIARCIALSGLARSQHGNAEAQAQTLASLDAALLQLQADRRASDPAGPPAEAELELDPAGYLTGWNRGAEYLFGYSAQEALGQHILFLYAEDDDDGNIAELLVDPERVVSEVRRRKKSGEMVWVRLAVTRKADADAEPCGMMVRLHALSSPLSDEDKVHLHARITGYSPAESIGQTPYLLRSGAHDADFRAQVRAAMQGYGPWRGEIIGKRKNGELFPQSVTISVVRDRSGQISHTFSLFSDISVHKDAEARMQRMANYDSLTGLPNLCLLTQLVDQGLTEARRNQQHGALMVVEISRIGAIADTLGHETGNELLCQIGRILRQALREADILARLDGAKFAIALLHIEKREHAAIVAQKLLDALAEPIVIGAHRLHVGASIGITVYPEDGGDTSALIRYADVATGKAAQSVEPALLFYSEDMNQRAKEHLRLESELRLALAHDELELFYQPKVSLRSGRIVGAEALLRWRHPLRGLVSPGVFIPVAEETGLILDLGTWVLEESCRQVRAWKDANLLMPPIAVNLSARQFDAGLPARIAAVLERHGVQPEQIMLEITESLLVRGTDNVVAIMNQLVAMGLALALDDFGTGYSSLAYLKKFPISTLKIDRSFVIGLPYEENDCAIARAIVTMAQQLRQEIVAEGVETAEQMSFLRELGCDQLQGYLFSQPVPAQDFERMLREGKRLAFGAR